MRRKEFHASYKRFNLGQLKDGLEHDVQNYSETHVGITGTGHGVMSILSLRKEAYWDVHRVMQTRDVEPNLSLRPRKG